ncbi:hypothetical protein ACLBWX_00975 [Methylobacterium sp. M6A4_1b]
MNAIEAALIRDDDYTSVWLWLDHAVTRDNAAGLVFDLELVFNVLINRAARTYLTVEQVSELRRLFPVCRQRCERYLPPHCGVEDVRAGFSAADRLLALWLRPPSKRAGHTIEHEPYAGILRFHGVLRSLRRAGSLPMAAVIPTAIKRNGCEIIPFPKPCQEHAR